MIKRIKTKTKKFLMKSSNKTISKNFRLNSENMKNVLIQRNSKVFIKDNEIKKIPNSFIGVFQNYYFISIKNKNDKWYGGYYENDGKINFFQIAPNDKIKIKTKSFISCFYCLLENQKYKTKITLFCENLYTNTKIVYKHNIYQTENPTNIIEKEIDLFVFKFKTIELYNNKLFIKSKNGVHQYTLEISFSEEFFSKIQDILISKKFKFVYKF